MNAEREKKTVTRATGKRFSSVDEYLSKQGTTDEVSSQVSELARATQLVDMLVESRRDCGMTQQQVAKKLGVTQGAISKLESSTDAELSVNDLKRYAQALQQRYVLTVGKPMNHVEAVKWHAFRIKEHLSALAALAHKDEEMDPAIQAFFGEAFFNILSILEKCQDELPYNETEVRLKRIDEKRKSTLAPA
jgi:transcriptional regulator with XRE-family HTH domain